MRTVNAALTAAVLTRNYAPAIVLACGVETIDQTRILKLEIHEIGRLGLANLVVRIDNHDEGAASFIAAIGSAPFTSTDGLRVGGVDYLIDRCTWWVTHITPSNPAGKSDYYTVEAQNAWSLLKAQPDLEAVYTNTPIGDLLEAAFVASGGTAISTDGAALFDTEIDFKFPAGWPYQPRVGDLAGYAENAQARAYGRFTADGATWYLFGGEEGPTAAGSIGDDGETRVLASFIGNRDCLNTIYINGESYAAAADITALAGVVNARRGFFNARHLTTLAQVQARRLQEVIEQIESHITGEIETEYDPRWEQWDYLELHGVPEVADGQIVRVAEVHLTYRAGYGYKQVLHVRAVCADAAFTEPSDIYLLPAITNLTGAFYMDDLVIGWAAVDEDAYPAFLCYDVYIDGVAHYTTTDNNFTYTSSMNRNTHGGVYDPVIAVTVWARSRFGPHGPAESGTFTNDNPYGDTIQDDFALYGGAALAQQQSSVLYWLQIDACEMLNPLIVYTDSTVDTSIKVEGGASIKTLDGSWYANYADDVGGNVDMDAEGRFTSNDYLCFAARTSAAAGGAHLTVRLEDSGARVLDYAVPDLLVQNVWLFVNVQRASLEAVAPVGFDWTEVVTIAFKGEFGSGYFWIDDVRMAKARISDDQPWNDTGGKWKPITGEDAVWHIEQDLRWQPGVFCLAQLNTKTAERWINLLQGDYTIARHYIIGVLLRDANSKASLYCSATNYLDGYGVRIDHAAQEILLDRYDNASRSTLASKAFTFSTNEIVTMAFERVGLAGIRVYAARTSAGILNARNLLISYEDDTYPIGKIGVIAHGCNCRFYRVRAGSPEHALTAEYAFATDPTGHVHASGAAFESATGTATRSTFDTASVTLPQLAERVKALIDDLQADRLIGV